MVDSAVYAVSAWVDDERYPVEIDKDSQKIGDVLAEDATDLARNGGLEEVEEVGVRAVIYI